MPIEASAEISAVVLVRSHAKLIVDCEGACDAVSDKCPTDAYLPIVVFVVLEILSVNAEHLKIVDGRAGIIIFKENCDSPADHLEHLVKCHVVQCSAAPRLRTACDMPVIGVEQVSVAVVPHTTLDPRRVVFREVERHDVGVSDPALLDSDDVTAHEQVECVEQATARKIADIESAVIRECVGI